MTSINTTSSVPQGFSIYQSQLGAPLEFLPALGTKELDDLVNAYIPGPGAMQQKRAQVSLEFLTHSQQTGQSFKYFVVSDFAVTNPDSPSLMPSPAQGSSSFTVSPVASDWDWSSVSGGNATGSSRSGSSRKSATASTRHQTAADFSHMPGMKIMTKEGLDVTNSASRGSKTKEQRDHAHLMRIIKACESCRKKKIRCDPSHKKRVAAAASQTTAKASKKTKVAMPAVSQKQVSLPPAFPGANTILPTAPSLDLDFFPTFEPVDDLAMPNEASASWEDLIHFPQDMDTDYDFFFDPEGHLTPSISNSSPSSSNSASSKSISPESLTTHVVSDLEGSQVSSIDIFATGELHNASAPQLPYLGVVGGHTNYTDFNLYSPASSFSEDERMLSATSSTLSTSADGVSHVRSPPDRPNAPCDETTFCSNSEQSDAVLLDGQLRWASSNTWTHSIEPVDVLACTGTSSHGALAMESVNADRLLGAVSLLEFWLREQSQLTFAKDILNLSGQHHTVLGDQPVRLYKSHFAREIKADIFFFLKKANAIDRSHVHNQPVMLTGPTASVCALLPRLTSRQLTSPKVSSSISAVSRPALNGPVSVRQALSAIVDDWRLTCIKELPSHIQTGNAHVQNGVVQTVRFIAPEALLEPKTDFLPDATTHIGCCNKFDHCWFRSSYPDGAKYFGFMLA